MASLSLYRHGAWACTYMQHAGCWAIPFRHLDMCMSSVGHSRPAHIGANWCKHHRLWPPFLIRGRSIKVRKPSWLFKWNHQESVYMTYDLTKSYYVNLKEMWPCRGSETIVNKKQTCSSKRSCQPFWGKKKMSRDCPESSSRLRTNGCTWDSSGQELWRRASFLSSCLYVVEARGP